MTTATEQQQRAVQQMNRNEQLQQLMTSWRKRIDVSTIPWLRPRAHRRGGEPSVVSQEQMAILCGLTPSYYGALERGQEGRYSETTLESIAEVAGLSDSERTVLYLLATGKEPQPRYCQPLPKLSPGLAAQLKTQLWPTYIYDSAWNVHAANDITWQWFPQLIEQPNLMRALFLTQESRSQFVSWTTVHAPRAVAQMKAQLSRTPNCNIVKAVIHDVLAGAQLAQRLWNEEPAVRLHDDGDRYALQLLGAPEPTIVERTASTLGRHPNLHMATLVPVDGHIPQLGLAPGSP